MKKIASLLVVSGIATLSSMQANAQSKFEGAYGQVGVGFTSATPSLTNSVLRPPAGNTPSSYTYNTSIDSTNSFTGAVGLGYTFAVAPKFTIGLGVDYLPFNGSSANFTQTNSNLSPSSTTYSWKQKQSFDLYIAPGVEVTPDGMLYGKFGYAGTSIGYGSGGSQNLTGYLVGLGYKQFITSGFYGFIEGNYTSYGEKTLTATGPWNSGTTGTYTNTAQFSANAFTGLIGVGYKF
jgi:opacity protein-like surface antigen